MRRVFLQLILPLCLSATAHAANWAGTYAYEAQEGYDGGGTAATGNPITLDLLLTLGPHGTCTLEADGYQTDFNASCTPAPRPDGGLDINFLAFTGNDVQVSGFFSTDYSKGQKLFSLLPSGKTAWGALQPDTAKTAQGRYFMAQTK